MCESDCFTKIGGLLAWFQFVQDNVTPPGTPEWIKHLVLAIGGGVFAVLFLAYGVWFLKKLRHLNEP